MGRSTTSCFKIISCGCINESVSRDDINVSSQNKNLDNPGWGLRKKSGKHLVQSNTVVTEKIPSSENKEISEPITMSSEPQINANISEKTPDSIWTEETPDSITKNAAASTMATKPASEEDGIKCEPVPDESESAALVIQTAVRRFLAERQLIKNKNAVKLQAVVRGHLVRNHAVGTLRCVQAIVKMQALVRARREKGVQNTAVNSTPTHISIEKLLSNRLARQLLESTPKTKQINIKCDPSKSDSAWNWLERWMSVSSTETLKSHTPDHDQEKVVINTENEVKTVTPSNDVGEATVSFEEKENLVNAEEDSNVKTLEEEPIPESMDLNTEARIEVHSAPEDPVSETKPIPENPVSETELKHTAKQIASDQSDSEGRKYVLGSRKASNPAFIAAQSKFEELTSPKTNPLKSPNSSSQDAEAGSGSPADVGSTDVMKPDNSSNQDDVAGSGSPADIGSTEVLKPVNSSNQDNVTGSGSGAPADVGSTDVSKLDNEVVSCVDDSSAGAGKATLVTDVEPGDYLAIHGSPVVRNSGSECRTELSITSTLDSPDQFEIENKKSEETKILSEAVGDMDMNVDNNNNNNNIDAVIPEKEVDQKLGDGDIALEPNEHEPVGSPRSHITTLESQGTPSSQVSTTTKKTKTDKKVSSQTRKSWSTSKKSSPVSSSVDSSLRSSLEQLPKDAKPMKRRNSTSSPKTDHGHESSVPSYMQATESARAKAVTSPRSSPDVHDKESYLKKRHSLPGAVNGRQGSPRVQRSMSQALQTTKGNGTQERKWQR